MSNISLNIAAACSHSWISNANSMLPCKVLKAFAAGVKALFGKYKVTITNQTESLIQRHPKSYFAIAVRPLLSRRTQQVTPSLNVGLNSFSERPPAYTSSPQYTREGFVMPNERGEFPPMYTSGKPPSYKVERDNYSPPSYEDTVSDILEPTHT